MRLHILNKVITCQEVLEEHIPAPAISVFIAELC